MNKNDFAKYPPMGWNSWDCYGAAVTEKELRQNADYMAKHLKEHGWEYVVCDIQWYEPTADTSHYHNFADLCMDEYGRVIPAPNRFPSAADGKGRVCAQQGAEVWYPHYAWHFASGSTSEYTGKRNVLYGETDRASGFDLRMEYGYVWCGCDEARCSGVL